MDGSLTEHPQQATLDLEVRDRVARVTFTRPRRANSLTPEVVADLHGVLDRVEADEGVRAVVLTGSGGYFCVGLDKDVVARGVVDHDYFAEELERVTALFRRIELFELPTLAVVNGLTR